MLTYGQNDDDVLYLYIHFAKMIQRAGRPYKTTTTRDDAILSGVYIIGNRGRVVVVALRCCTQHHTITRDERRRCAPCTFTDNAPPSIIVL